MQCPGMELAMSRTHYLMSVLLLVFFFQVTVASLLSLSSSALLDNVDKLMFLVYLVQGHCVNYFNIPETAYPGLHIQGCISRAAYPGLHSGLRGRGGGGGGGGKSNFFFF